MPFSAVVFYVLLLLGPVFLVLVPAVHAGKRRRFGWLVVVLLVPHLGGAVYWLKALPASGVRPLTRHTAGRNRGGRGR